MKNFLYNLKLKRDFDRIYLLGWAGFFFLLVGTLLEYSAGIGGGLTFFKIIGILIFYKLYFRTIKELYYSYWSFSLFILVYCVFGMYEGAFTYKMNGLFYCYFLGMIITWIQQFILFSPIYYPRVRWWEYDFRYRDDLKIKIQKNNISNLRAKKVEEIKKGPEVMGRLTDLRRSSGCVVSFEKYKVGDLLIIHSQEDSKQLILRCEVMSQRIYSIGRGINYGVKFYFQGADEKKDFLAFCAFWKQQRSSKIEMKFNNEASKCE